MLWVFVRGDWLAQDCRRRKTRLQRIWEMRTRGVRLLCLFRCMESNSPFLLNSRVLILAPISFMSH